MITLTKPYYPALEWWTAAGPFLKIHSDGRWEFPGDMADDERAKEFVKLTLDLVGQLKDINPCPAHNPLNVELVIFEDDDRCIQCGAVEGTSDYGTVGDGFDGLCPSCADAADVEEN